MITTLRTKLTKDSIETKTFTIDLTDKFGDLTLASISGTEATGVTVNSVSVDADQVLTIVIAGGVDFNEYRVIVNGLLSNSTAIKLGIIVLVTDNQDQYYGSVYSAGIHLRSAAWNEAEESDQLQALIRATRAIDRLNYVGEISEATQMMQFPRGTDTEVPKDIEIACYEEAALLLSGADPQAEMANLSAVAQGISTVRTTYDRAVVSDNVRAGIISHIAWSYLVPYLRDPNEIVMSRV